MSLTVRFVDDCRARVTQVLHEQFGHESLVRCTRTKALGYSISLVFEVAAPERPVQRVYAKVRRAGKFGPVCDIGLDMRAVRLARSEFALLRAADLWFSAHQPQFGVVKPLAYLEDCNAIIVLGASGRSLDSMLSEDTAEAATHVERAGRWLRHFHEDVCSPEVVPFSSEHYVRRLDHSVAALVAGGYDKRRAGSLREDIFEQARRFEGLDCRHSTIHGDYKMRHIWASTERLEVLDFGNARRAPIFEDLAAFLVELEVLQFGKPGNGGFVQLASAFLEGYGDVESPLLLSVHLALARIKKWSRRRTRISSSVAGRRLQSALKSTRTEALVQRMYVDPWFNSRIARELAWLGVQEADGGARAVAQIGSIASRSGVVAARARGLRS